ncbi:MAG: NAD(P)H-binding protein [Thermoplasmata archaeon]|nr:NAD(P)H-binding protein [Thermoplasmata archaeon]
MFGGSGKTGQELISAILRRRMKVRALYRPGSEPKQSLPGLTVIIGQVNEPADIRKTLEGTNGAIVVFGPRLGKHHNPQPFCADSTAKIVAEMKKLNISRLIVQTGAMAGGGDAPNLSKIVRRFSARYKRNYPAIYKDREAQEAITRESGLDWTLVRPFRIANGKGKGSPKVAQSVRIGMFTSIRRADLAKFLTDELSAGRFHRQTIYIAN